MLHLPSNRENQVKNRIRIKTKAAIPVNTLALPQKHSRETKKWAFIQHSDFLQQKRWSDYWRGIEVGTDKLRLLGIRSK